MRGNAGSHLTKDVVPYDDMAAWLGVAENTPTVHHDAGTTPPSETAIADWDTFFEEHAANANKLCALLSGYNVECSVVGYKGVHSFESAGAAFAAALPWLASTLGTPGVRPRALPGADGEVAHAQSASRDVID